MIFYSLCIFTKTNTIQSKFLNYVNFTYKVQNQWLVDEDILKQLVVNTELFDK